MKTGRAAADAETSAALSLKECPRWCTEHTGFDDASDDWHQSRALQAAGLTLLLSDGTLDQRTQVFIEGLLPDDGMSLETAESLARAILALVEAGRGNQPVAIGPGGRAAETVGRAASGRHDQERSR